VPTSSPKFSANGSLLLKRGLRLLAGSWLAVMLAGACSDPDSPPGYRERSGGSGGGGNNPVAGITGEAGDTMGGIGGEVSDAGASTGGKGGRGGTGGKAGSGGGGNGGGGGMGGPTCGDMKIESPEDCEDGNVLNFDGCSSDCKSTCEDCLEEFYAEDGDYKVYVEFCKNSMDVAVEGPATGVPRSKLCQDVAACIVNSGCAKEQARLGGGEFLDLCYCGKGVTHAECSTGGPAGMGNPQGPCATQFAAAAEFRSYDEVLNRLHQVTLGLGWAVNLISLGTGLGYCLDPCGLDRPLNDCTRCAAGDVHTFERTATCPNCFDASSRSCNRELLDCVQANCTGADLQPCLSPSGPCATEIAALPPIKASMPGKPDVPNPALVATTKDLECRAQNCAAECFKP
jgi:cysteine-rich repeat protein